MAWSRVVNWGIHSSPFLAFAIAAGVALAAAFLVDDGGVAALGAQVADLLGGEAVGGRLGVAVAIAVGEGGFVCGSGVGEIGGQGLGDTVGQRADAVGAKAERAAAADTGELAEDLFEAGARGNGRGKAQDVGDQAPEGLGDGGDLGAGLGGGEEDLERLAAAVLVDGDESLADGGIDVIGAAGEHGGTGLLGVVPEHLAFGQLGGLLGGGGVGLEDDLIARAGDVDGNALAAQSPGHLVGGGDLICGGAGGEVDGLGEAVVDEGLHGGLHADVLLGGDVAGDDKDLAQGAGQVLDILAMALSDDLVDDGLLGGVIQAGFLEGLGKERAGVGELEVLAVVVDVADVGQGEDRLAAVALAAGDGGDGAGGGDSGLGSVADAVLLDALEDLLPIEGRAAKIALVALERRGRLPGELFGIVDAALDGGEGTALLGEINAGAHGVVADELHDLGDELLAFFGAVTDAGEIHQVGEAHNAQADAAGLQGGFLELGDGGDIGIGLDDIVEETGGELNAVAQAGPIDGAVGAEVLGEVDGTQAAILVGAKPLLAAGIGGLEGVEVGNRVGAVGGVEEEQAGFAVVVGLGDDLVEEGAGAQGAVGEDGQAGRLGFVEGAVEAFAFGGGDVEEAQRPIGVLFDGLHKGVGDADGNVEIGDGILVSLAVNEFFDIGMIDAENGHVGAAAGAALGDLAEGLVVDVQEADRAGGFAGGGFNAHTLGAQAREGKAISAAGLLNEGGVAQGLENTGGVAAHVVGDGQHEAGGELAEGRAGAGEGGRIGEEALGGKQVVELDSEVVRVLLPVGFDFGNMVGNAPEGFLDVFDRLAVVAAAGIAAHEDTAGVLGQFNGRHVWG